VSAVATRATSTDKKTYEKKPLRYRFRKAWRAVLFVALAPFFEPSLITSLLPFSVPNALVKFAAGVLVLIPLSTFIEVVTEDLIERLGQLVGGLLHAFFGNIAYFVLTASALFTAASLPAGSAERGDIVTIVQSSIGGTIVIDILFILGVSVFIGGMKNGRMQFSAEYSNQYAEMLTVAVIALALPTLAQQFSVGLRFGDNSLNINSSDVSVLSNITAIILIVAYIGYLGWTVFKFRDIAAKVENPTEVAMETRGDELGPFAPQAAADEGARQAEQYAAETLRRNQAPPPPVAAMTPAADSSTIAGIINARIERERRERRQQPTRAEQEAEDRNRGIAFWEFAILIAGTAGVVFISENMAKIFEDTQFTSGLGLNAFFVGFIVLPIASNLVELSAAVSTAWHNRMETCLAVTAGSAIQVALLIAPLLVLVAHLAGLGEFTLTFSLFVLAIFALIAYYFQIMTVDGETTWLEGLQIASFFAVIVAVAVLAGPNK
jgi:Ca2+:H+ antiporter